MSLRCSESRRSRNDARKKGIDLAKLSPHQVSDIWPLLPMQESLLLYSESIAKNHDYYGRFCFILSGNLDKARFDQAWEIVVQRHEMLRVVFRWKETKQPVQLVLQEYERPVQHLTILNNRRRKRNSSSSC